MSTSSMALRNKLLTTAINDSDFRAALVADANAAVASSFGIRDLDVIVHEEGADELQLIIPEYNADVEAELRRIKGELKSSGRAPTRGELECLIVLSAWEDADYKASLLADPVAVVMAEVEKFGGFSPTDISVSVHVEVPGQCLIVLPAANDSGELSEDELEEVAGGVWPIVYIVGAVAITIAGHIATSIVDDLTQVAAPGGGGIKSLPEER